MSETCSVCGGIQLLPSKQFYHEEFCWHNKRSVLDIPDWPGWKKFHEIYRRYEDTRNPEDCRLYFLTLFNGGFRREESTLIRRDMIAFNDEVVVIYNAPVHKKKNRTTRNIVIPLDEKNPLAHEFLEVIEDRQTEYLLPAKLPFGMGDMDIGSASSKTVYNRMRDMNTFPHAIRAYRAMHLVAERKFTPQDLMGWFDWSNASMALHYTKTRAMADRLGIETLPPLS